MATTKDFSEIVLEIEDGLKNLATLAVGVDFADQTERQKYFDNVLSVRRIYIAEEADGFQCNASNALHQLQVISWIDELHTSLRHGTHISDIVEQSKFIQQQLGGLDRLLMVLSNKAHFVGCSRTAIDGSFK